MEVKTAPQAAVTVQATEPGVYPVGFVCVVEMVDADGNHHVVVDASVGASLDRQRAWLKQAGEVLDAPPLQP